MPRLSRRLLILPLLLLVPLGVLKWRADHPPVSKMDKELRAAFGQATSVRINSVGLSWRQITGLSSDMGLLGEEKAIRNLYVKDKKTVDELIGTLRCTDEAAPVSVNSKGTANITLYFTWPESQSQQMKWNALTYVQTPQGRFLQLFYVSSTMKPFRRSLLRKTQFVRVQPRFAPQFEALFRGLAQRAQAKGPHPNVSLDWMVF